MKILVIGGSGFIGTRLVRELISLGHNVYIYDITTSVEFPELTINGDVRSLDSLSAALTRDTDIIFNLAAEHKDNVDPPSLYFDVNVEGAKNIVKAAKKCCVERIIFTSSVAIYGLNKAMPSETSPADPFNDYGKSKLQAEHIFTEWANGSTCRSLTIVRPAVIFGEGNRGNVYNLIKQIDKRAFIMVGNGKNRKSMGYVGNLVEFLCSSIELQGNNIFNYCDKPDLSSHEIAEYIADALGRNIPSIKIPLMVGLYVGFVFDIIAKITGRSFPISSTRIRKFTSETVISTEKLQSTGFKPTISLKDGINRAIRFEFRS